MDSRIGPCVEMMDSVPRSSGEAGVVVTMKGHGCPRLAPEGASEYVKELLDGTGEVPVKVAMAPAALCSGMETFTKASEGGICVGVTVMKTLAEAEKAGPSTPLSATLMVSV